MMALNPESAKKPLNGQQSPRPSTPPPVSASRPAGPTIRPPSTAGPRIVPPISGRTPAQRSGNTQSQVGATHWMCGTCKKLLAPDCVNKGLAVLQDGRMICVECQVSRAKKPKIDTSDTKLGRTLLAIAGGAVAILAVVGIFFPAQACFIAALLGGVCVLAGVLGLTLQGATRLILAGGGLVLALGCAFGISFINAARDEAEAAHLLDASIAEIQALVKADKISEAISKQGTAEKRAMPVKGFVSPAAERAVLRSRQTIEDWFKTNYSEIDPQTRQVLEELLVLYPARTESGLLKFRSIRREGKLISATVLTDDKSEKSDVKIAGGKALPCGPNVLVEAAGVGAKLAGAPQIENVSLEIIAVKGQEEVPVGSMLLNKQDYLMLQAAEMQVDQIARQVKFK